jgi:trehalose 6-phosphate synthase/phosphatase
MFRTLRHSQLPEDHRYAVTVGAKTKQTLASWHLLEPADVISAIALLNGNKEGGNAAVAAQVDAELKK